MARLRTINPDVKSVAQANSVAVIGLGRFGRSLALELMANGTEVLGIDASEEIVQSLNAQLTHVVQADTTKEEVLRQLSVPDFDRVVVAIGSDVQSSILTTSLLLRFGIQNLFEPNGHIPVVPVVVEVKQLIARLVQGFVEPHLVGGYPVLLAIFDVERAKEMFGVAIERIAAEGEAVQVGVGPFEGFLQHLVENVEM